MIKNNNTMIRGIEKRGCIIGDKNKIKNKNGHYTWKKKKFICKSRSVRDLFYFCPTRRRVTRNMIQTV